MNMVADELDKDEERLGIRCGYDVCIRTVTIA